MPKSGRCTVPQYDKRREDQRGSLGRYDYTSMLLLFRWISVRIVEFVETQPTSQPSDSRIDTYIDATLPHDKEVHEALHGTHHVRPSRLSHVSPSPSFTAS